MNSYPQKPVVARPKIVSQGGCRVNRLLGLMLLILCVVGLSLPAMATAPITPISQTVLPLGTCAPGDTSLSPGETNTVVFVFQNTSGGDLANVSVELSEPNNYFQFQAPQTVGALPNNGTASVTFQFRNNAPCGAPVTPIITVKNTVNNTTTTVGTANYAASISGATVNTTYTFVNNNPITIKTGVGTKSDPYGTAIAVANVPNVSGLAGERVTSVTVTLTGITHSYSPDIQLLLVSPNGTVALMGNAGGATLSTAPISNVNLTFTSDNTAPFLPASTAGAPQITSGTYRPSVFNPAQFTFPSPAPAPPYSTDLSSILGSAQNGTWTLYVANNGNGSGTIASGWAVNLTTTQVSCCGAGQTFPTVTLSNTVPSIDECGSVVCADSSKNQVIAVANISDLETAANGLTVTAHSSNQAIVSDANLVVDTSGAARNVTLKKPEVNAFGPTTISVTVTDPQGHTGTASYTLTINFKNQPPVITAPINQEFTGTAGVPTPAIPFSVTDVETPAGSINVVAVPKTAADAVYIPQPNIFISGNPGGLNGDPTARTITVIPAAIPNPNTTPVTIAITAIDSNSGTTEVDYLVQFSGTAGCPTITPLAPSVDENKVYTTSVTVHSGSTSIADSSVTIDPNSITSSNPGLVPASAVVFSGSGSVRTLTITPALNQSGTATISFNLNNGSCVATKHYVVTVNFVNQAPTISSIVTQVINEDSAGTGALAFTVHDVEDDAASLPLSVSSSVTSSVANLVAVNLAGTGASRTVTVIPGTHLFGNATVTLTVTDSASKSTSTSFIVIVNAVNQPPSISNVTVPAGQPNVPVQGPLDLNGATPPTVTLPEDSGATIANSNNHSVNIGLNGIGAGPGNEIAQSVAVSASVSSTLVGVVSVGTVTPATVTSPTFNTTLTLILQATKAGSGDVTITLQDNGGTVNGGHDTTTKVFHLVVTPFNYTPVVVVDPNNNPDTNNVPKNQAITLPLSITDKETPAPLITSQASVAATSSDPLGVYQGAIVNSTRTSMTVLLNPVFTNSANVAQLPYTVTFNLTNTDVAVGTAPANTVVTPVRLIIVNKAPPVLTVNPTSQNIDQDSVGLTTLTIHDNQDITTELRPNMALVDPCKSAIGFPSELFGQSDNPAVIANDGTGILFGNLTVTGTTDGVNTDGTRTIAFVPTPGPHGSNNVAHITITGVDNECLSSFATFTITVRDIPHAPTIAMTSATPIVIPENGSSSDSSTTSKKVEFVINDVDTGPASLTVNTSSANTTLIPNANIQVGLPSAGATSQTRTLVITPAANQYGSTTVTLQAVDPSGLAAAITVPVTVTRINQPPTINAIPNQSIAEDAGQQTVAISGITAGANDSDQTVTLSVSATDKGSNPATQNLLTGLTVTDYDAAHGTANVKFTPVLHASGTSTVTVTATDNGTPSKATSQSFDVLIGFVNHLPVISLAPIVGGTSCDPTGGTNAISVTLARVSGTISPSGVINVYLCDVESKVNNTGGLDLNLAASSSNPLFIPNDASHLIIGGSGYNRSIVIVPNQLDAGGTADVVLTVTDANGGAATATIHVNAVPSGCPSISSIPNQTTQINTDTDLIFFAVTDPIVPATSLTVTATSSNTSVVNNGTSNIQIGGTGTTRAMIIRPNQDATGQTTITVSVNNGSCTRSTTFVLTVQGPPPTITSVPDQTIGVNSSTARLPFTVNDSITFPALLNVGGSSSDQTIIPNANIFILPAGGGARTVTVLAGSTTGQSTITLTVTNLSGGTASSAFKVTVVDTNPPPVITAVGSTNQTTTVNKPTGLINFVVGDAVTPAASLVVTATSGNTTLVPNSPNNIVVLSPPNSPSVRSVVITPAQDQTGSAIITVTVKNNANKTSSTTFLLTVTSVSIPNDFNGDRTQDILLQDANFFVGAWLMSGDDLLQGVLLNPNNAGTGWKIVDTGDFNGDTHTDILYQYTDGSLAVWLMNGTTLMSTASLNPGNSGPDWRAVATGDFNRDGKPDILFRNKKDGSLAVWLMDGINMTSVVSLSPSNPGTGWSPVGTGDVDGDGHTDIIFRNTDGTLGVWYMTGATGTNLLLASLLNPSTSGDPNWVAVGVIDLNGDGKPDLLFQNSATRDIAVWYMNGPNLLVSKLLTPSNPGGTWGVAAPKN
jgi:subtilisin-like proprotein convertase family protein